MAPTAPIRPRPKQSCGKAKASTSITSRKEAAALGGRAAALKWPECEAGARAQQNRLVAGLNAAIDGLVGVLAVIVVPDPDGDRDGLVIAARLIGAVGVGRAIVVAMAIIVAIAIVVMSIGGGSA